MDSANYRDLLILNGGFRYDDYNINDVRILDGPATPSVSSRQSS